MIALCPIPVLVVDIAVKYLFGRKKDEEEIPGSSTCIQHFRGLLGYDERQHGIG